MIRNSINVPKTLPIYVLLTILQCSLFASSLYAEQLYLDQERMEANSSSLNFTSTMPEGGWRVTHQELVIPELQQEAAAVRARNQAAIDKASGRSGFRQEQQQEAAAFSARNQIVIKVASEPGFWQAAHASLRTGPTSRRIEAWMDWKEWEASADYDPDFNPQQHLNTVEEMWGVQLNDYAVKHLSQATSFGELTKTAQRLRRHQDFQTTAAQRPVAAFVGSMGDPGAVFVLIVILSVLIKKLLVKKQNQ